MSSANVVRLPNLVIAGVNKAGTTSLFRYLATHPDVCASSVKETCYFLPLRYGEEMSPLGEYSRLFSHYGGEKVIMEATPGYFYGGAKLARAVKDNLGDTKVVLVFRDPVARFFSFFEFMKSSLLIDKDMGARDYYSACLAMSNDDLRCREKNMYFGLEGGCYSKYLPDWKDVFGEDLKAIFFDDLVASPAKVLADLSGFIGLDPSPFSGLGFTQENKTRGFTNKWLHSLALNMYRNGGVSKYPKLRKWLTLIYYAINGSSKAREVDAELKSEIRNYYAERNAGLFEILEGIPGIKRPFPAWVMPCVSRG